MDILKTITVGGTQYDIAPKASDTRYGAVKIGKGLTLGTETEDKSLIVRLGTEGCLIFGPAGGVELDLVYLFNNKLVWGGGLLGTVSGNSSTIDPYSEKKRSPLSVVFGTSAVWQGGATHGFGTQLYKVLSEAHIQARTDIPDLWIQLTGMETVSLTTLKDYLYPVGNLADGQILGSIAGMSMMIHWQRIFAVSAEEQYGCKVDMGLIDINNVGMMWSANGLIIPRVGSITGPYIQWGDTYGTVYNDKVAG